MTRPESHRRRRIKYIDHRLQFWLIAALVLLEITITLLGTGYLYLVLDQRLEQQLYSVHRAAEGLYIDLFTQVGYVLAGMTFANLLALLVADYLWRRYVGGVTRKLRRGLLLTRDLDLRPYPINRGTHRILDRLDMWRNSERQRMESIWTGLQAVMQESQPPEQQRLRQRIRHLAQQLPGECRLSDRDSTSVNR